LPGWPENGSNGFCAGCASAAEAVNSNATAANRTCNGLNLITVNLPFQFN
jgi:hypothetical protein